VSAILTDVVEIFTCPQGEFGPDTPVSQGQFKALIEHNTEVQFTPKGKRDQSTTQDVRNIALVDPASVNFTRPLKLKELKIRGVNQPDVVYDVITIRAAYFGMVEVLYV